MADVVVAAGVHAARDVEVDFADVENVVEVVEAGLDGVGDGDRLGVGEVAEVAAGAADDAGEQADVGVVRPIARRLPDGVEVGLPDVGKDDVLLVGNPQFAEAVAVGQIGDGSIWSALMSPGPGRVS